MRFLQESGVITEIIKQQMASDNMVEKSQINSGKHHKKNKDNSRKQIRGSGLLLAGRFLSLGLNFATQVLIVRHLSKGDYGAWAYCLSFIALFQAFSTMGLKRAVSRFLPIYYEQEDYGKFFGILVLVLITIVITGVIFTNGIYFSPDALRQLIKDDKEIFEILLILIFLVPVEAIDTTITNIFASFYKSKAIFFRRNVLAPSLKLLVVCTLIYMEGSVLFLAAGYLMVTVFGVIIYFPMVIRMFRQEGVLEHFSVRKVNIPAKEVFSFALPLLTSDLVMIAMHSSDTLMLGYFHNTEEVALYQVILPLAHFNTLVMASFAMLYTPSAARLFARQDYDGINGLYWQTAIWLAVLSFPIFSLTFIAAKQITVMLYGEQYADSWIFLQIMSGAYFFHVVLGFNGLTLKVLGKVKFVVIINLIAVIINIALNLFFIPKYGALGATIATAGSMFCHNFLKQWGLMKAGVKVFDREYLPHYLLIVASTCILFMIQLFVTDNLFILVPIIIITSLIVLRLSAKKLKIEETFPELMKIPLMRVLLRA